MYNNLLQRPEWAYTIASMASKVLDMDLSAIRKRLIPMEPGELTIPLPYPGVRVRYADGHVVPALWEGTVYKPMPLSSSSQTLRGNVVL